MVRVLLFGSLRRYGPPCEPGGPAVLSAATGPSVTAAEVLAAQGIPLAEVANLFVNGRLATMAHPITDGDRLGIFGRDMALLYV